MEFHFSKKGLYQVAAFLAAAAILFIITYASILRQGNKGEGNDEPKTAQNDNQKGINSRKLEGMKSFSSEDEFGEYIKQGEQISVSRYGPELMFSSPMATGLPESSLGGMNWAESDSGAQKASRYSETNVQVAGIDEPDILKTDGENIFFSRQQYWRGGMIDSWDGDVIEERSMMPAPINEVDIVKAFPPGDLKNISQIEKQGNLLLKDDLLAVIAEDGIYGYGLADPQKPKEAWNIKFNEGRTSYVSARLYGGDIYLVTRNRINRYRSCPIEPFEAGGEKITIGCGEIYHPETPIPVDSTFQISKINMASGQIEKNVTFVGSSADSMVYMSQDNIYITYSYPGDFVSVLVDFYAENDGLIPDELEEKIKKLESYDISSNAKMTEIRGLIDKHLANLSDDDQMKFRNEMENKMSEYLKTRQRDLEFTGIAKVRVSDLKLQESGSVPGHPLNQFSLDEYRDDLRVATTIEGNFWWLGFGGRTVSANDVYVLGSDMEIKGSVKDLGKGERIYSVRFIEDQGYVVTFRQVDPFYVINLADPADPAVSGELKIPGYSSYLHPLKENIILGIGMEEQKVKISLFDVSDPGNPREIAKYNLSDYWTDVSNTHHAFLQDADKEIFFLPGGEGGYIFSYRDNKLDLVKAVSDIQVKRAVYINDYFYVVSEEKISVFNQSDWQKVNEINL